MTRDEVVNRALLLKDWKYIYGFKYSTSLVTLSRIQSLANLYPNVFTDSYINKAIQFRGENAIDCSGLNCYAYGISDISSSVIGNLPNTKPDQYSYKNLNGDIEKGDSVWMSGHCGLYIGNGKVIEARGINYGVVVTNLADRPWLKVISPNNLTLAYYINVDEWNMDNTGWWYPYGENKGEYYKNTVATIDGKQYAFNSDGYCLSKPEIDCTSKGDITYITGEILK